MGIIVVQSGNAKRLERIPIEKEGYLQQYIYKNPDCLPLHELKENLELLVLAREVRTSSGPIDALAVDQEGDIYVIETKLYKNPDKRRVIAQMLDYGAALWEDRADFLQSTLEGAVSTGFGTSLQEKLRDYFELEDEGVTEIVGNISSNFDAGRFRFVVLMDRMDERLKTLIRFVNTNSNFRMLGVELDFYQHDEFEVLIPNIYGAEARQEVRPATAPRVHPTWSEATVFEQAEKVLTPDALVELRRLYEWAVRSGDVNFAGTTDGAFTVTFAHIVPRVMMKVLSNGRIAFRFGRLGDFGRILRRRIEEANLFPMKAIPNPKVQSSEWIPVASRLREVIEAAAAEARTTQRSPDVV